jgi:hypothetical protein
MNARYAILATFVGALMALSIFASVGNSIALADSQDEQNSDRMNHLQSIFHDHFNLAEVESEGQSAAFVSTSSSQVDGNFTRIMYGVFASAEEVPTMAVALYNATGSSSDGGRNMSVTWAVGGISLLGLFEFNDTAGTGVYNKTQDGQPLSKINFDEIPWTLTTKQITGPGGASGYEIDITGTNGTFSFTMSADIFNTGVVIAGTPVAPTEAKINFSIQNYPFVSSNGDLALIAIFGGQQHYGNISTVISVSTTGSGDETVETYNRQTTASISKSSFSYFTWSSTATVDGQSKPVQSEQLNNGTFYRILLNYPHGNSILHDPILGVGVGSPSDIPGYGAASALSAGASFDLYLIAGAVVVVAFISLLALTARRRMIEPRLMA